MRLTAEQEAIVAHTTGPGLVFAVAGSGKTTSMVHRIQHLIRRKIVTPPEILATSFNTAAVRDIALQLESIGVPEGVQCRTLHSLGFRIIQSAVRRNYLPRAWLNNRSSNSESVSGQLISQALLKMARTAGCDITDLNIDREDLKNQISIWKGNLAYADLEGAELPDAAADFASQATHKLIQYVQAYREYEKLRIQRKVITFDDMLMLGWETLIRHPEILQSVQSAYKMVMVDEFQDVNFAQYQIIDLITAPHRNYMAIGDDDQCIYEWRGANPRFILDFEKVYDANVYTISDNFRSKGQQIVLANQVISQNQNRYKKQLNLTRGFDGATFFHEKKDDGEIAAEIVQEIQKLFKQGKTALDLAILIRLYSQTALLEMEFIAAQIPYVVEGGKPFYARPELIPLFQYLSFAAYEADIRKNGFPEDPVKGKKYMTMFKNIINQPRRYVSKDFIATVSNYASNKKWSILETMMMHRGKLKPGSLKQVEIFVDVINRLIRKLNKPAFKTLNWLAGEIDYADHLINISGMRELGISRLQNVDALIELSKTKGNCHDFLAYIRDISVNAIPNPKNLPPVKLMTIYRAKGLEWETVFVPGCNDGLIPCSMIAKENNPDQTAVEMEAERRLFYVAITRAKKTLHLYAGKDREVSSFLSEINTPAVLKQLAVLTSVFEQEKSISKRDKVIEVCRLISDFHLTRYLSHWMQPSKKFKNYIHLLLDGLERDIAEAKSFQEKYDIELKVFRQKKKAYQSRHNDWKKAVKQQAIPVRIFKSAQQKLAGGQSLTFDLFEDGSIMAMAEKGVIGVVETKKVTDIDWKRIAWQHSIGRIEKYDKAKHFLTFLFLEISLDKSHPDYDQPKPLPPKKPAEKYRTLLTSDFREGYLALKNVVNS